MNPILARSSRLLALSGLVFFGAGAASAAVVTGNAAEVVSDVHHPNGNTYDQVLINGTTASVQADPGQVVRVSFIDLNDDIIQVEFSGRGTLSITLEAANGPAVPKKYAQSVLYMKGHALIEIQGS